MNLLDALGKLFSRGPGSGYIDVLRMLASHREGLTLTELVRLRGKKAYEYTRRILRKLIAVGLVEVRFIDGRKVYTLSSLGEKLVSDPLSDSTKCCSECVELFLAGHNTAIRVAHEYSMATGLKLNWLIGAGVYWRGTSFKPDTYLELLSEFVNKLFIDSGAQQFYKDFKGVDYPYTTRQYLEFALSLRPSLIATLDLPLDILVPRGLPIHEGIKRTVERGVEMVSEAEKLDIDNDSILIVPVIQGYDDPSQWLECIDLYKQHGISPHKFPVWGVGSLCMTKSPRFVESVIREVRKYLGSYVRIHVFGISMNSLRRVFSLINSYDTSAWVYWAKIDGAILVWSPRRGTFIHMQTRNGYRYEVYDFMEVNLIQILEMHRYLSKKLCSKP